MDHATASQVEAALIDAFPDLINVVGGIRADAYGVAHAAEIIRHYRAEEASFEHFLRAQSTVDQRKPDRRGEIVV